MNPLIVTTTAVTSLVVGYIHKRWVILGHLEELEKHHHKFHEALQAMVTKSEQESSHVTSDQRIQEAFSGEHLRELQALIDAELLQETAGKINHAIRHHATNPSPRQEPDQHLYAAMLGLGGLSGGHYRY